MTLFALPASPVAAPRRLIPARRGNLVLLTDEEGAAILDDDYDLLWGDYTTDIDED